jgi:hypothetical protein
VSSTEDKNKLLVKGVSSMHEGLLPIGAILTHYNMHMSSSVTWLSEIQQLLIRAAFVENARRGYSRKCSLIIRQALLWAGKWDEKCTSHHQMDSENPIISSYYSALVEMVRNPGEKRLINGLGNFDAPADPPFTECSLTEAGEEIAQILLEGPPTLNV